MDTEAIITRYKEAYRSVHGKEIEIKHKGGGWYHLDDGRYGSIHRPKEIENMAWNLEHRNKTPLSV